MDASVDGARDVTAGERAWNPADLSAEQLRAVLVSIALEWERRWGVAPSITSILSEYDAARLVGHTTQSLSEDAFGRTAVKRGSDFSFKGERYQVKACRPSGKPGSDVWHVPEARNYEWHRLIWILYDREYRIVEAWEWLVDKYRSKFEGVKIIRPYMMREGRPLHLQNPTRDLAAPPASDR